MSSTREHRIADLSEALQAYHRDYASQIAEYIDEFCKRKEQTRSRVFKPCKRCFQCDNSISDPNALFCDRRCSEAYNSERDPLY